MKEYTLREAIKIKSKMLDQWDNGLYRLRRLSDNHGMLVEVKGHFNIKLKEIKMNMFQLIFSKQKYTLEPYVSYILDYRYNAVRFIFRKPNRTHSYMIGADEIFCSKDLNAMFGNLMYVAATNFINSEERGVG